MRVRFANAHWCEAALDGPGGVRYSKQNFNEQLQSSIEDLHEEIGPIGSWCALPFRGSFLLGEVKEQCPK